MSRAYWALTNNDLKELSKLAIREHEDFFQRNPHLKAFFYNSLIAICLCQGAALHYIDCQTGIKDFDIWHFYQANPRSTFPYRALRSIEAGYKGIRIDFLKRAIPEQICRLSPNDPGQIILSFLRARDTQTKKELLEKAVVGLWPPKLLGEILWDGRQK